MKQIQSDKSELKEAGFSLPTKDYLARRIDSTFERTLPYELLQRVLFDPAADILSRSSKAIRAQLVDAGFHFACQNQGVTAIEVEADLQACKQAVELLHAGSLIIDDIQDRSEVRRGGPSIHCKYGVAGAITTGNWLYFWPLHILRSTRLPEADKYRLIERFTECLEFAHYGQSLDVSVKADDLPQADVAEICRWVATHKTGVLTALSLQMGAICAGADEQLLFEIKSFGLKFGRCLQNFDDLGNFYGYVDKEKHWEDLRERSPSWIWVCAAENLAPSDYDNFVAGVRTLPDPAPLQEWIELQRFTTLLNQVTQQELAATLSELSSLPAASRAVDIINQLAETLKHAYTSKPA